MLKLAIIGDLHHDFTRFDVEYFNASTYDLLLLTGDLPYQGSKQDKQLVERLAALTRPALVIPGNHDCITYSQFIAEIKGMTRLTGWSNHNQQAMVGELREQIAPVTVCGYSSHEFQSEEMEICVIAARPLSFGGPELTNRRYLEANFAVDSLETSARHLEAMIDKTPQTHLIFLSHNGPTGLGAEAEDIWGCDFRREAGDYGDPDLEAAIVYAKSSASKCLSLLPVTCITPCSPGVSATGWWNKPGQPTSMRRASRASLPRAIKPITTMSKSCSTPTVSSSKKDWFLIVDKRVSLKYT